MIINSIKKSLNIMNWKFADISLLVLIISMSGMLVTNVFITYITSSFDENVIELSKRISWEIFSMGMFFGIFELIFISKDNKEKQITPLLITSFKNMIPAIPLAVIIAVITFFGTKYVALSYYLIKIIFGFSYCEYYFGSRKVNKAIVDSLKYVVKHNLKAVLLLFFSGLIRIAIYLLVGSIISPFSLLSVVLKPFIDYLTLSFFIIVISNFYLDSKKFEEEIKVDFT